MLLASFILISNLLAPETVYANGTPMDFATGPITPVPVTAGSSIDSYVTRSNDVRRTPHLLVASGVTIRVAL